MVAIPSPGTTGNDIIIPGDGGDTLYGDPFDVNPFSTGRGGNDRLSATGQQNRLFGDANVMSGDARGGNDRLVTTGFQSRPHGDSGIMLDEAGGGNDHIIATGDNHLALGDTNNMLGHARGGNDTVVVIADGYGSGSAFGDAIAMGNDGNDAHGGTTTCPSSVPTATLSAMPIPCAATQEAETTS